MGENYPRDNARTLMLPHDVNSTRNVLAGLRHDENQRIDDENTKKDSQPLVLLHHLIRAEKLPTRIAILRQLVRHDSRPYSAILLRCALHGIVIQRQYDLIRYYTTVISPVKDVELLTSAAVLLLRDHSFLDAPGSLEFFKALGPLKGSESLYAALHLALRCNPEVAVAVWSQNVNPNFDNIQLPGGMLLELISTIDQRNQINESESGLANMCNVLNRLILHPIHRVHLFEIEPFPYRLVEWLSTTTNKTLAEAAAIIMAKTTDLHDWHQHTRVQHRLWELAIEGRALDAVVRIAAQNTTDIALVHAVAAHINLNDVAVQESSILATKAVKRMVRSLSSRVQMFPEALDLLAKLSTAKNRHVRFWAVQGLAEEAQDDTTARFYLARSNFCLRTLLVAMKKDYCLRVREASVNAVCAIAKDPSNVVALVRRSDFVPSLVDCVWNLLGDFPHGVNQNTLANISCNDLMEALLVLISHKMADPDRLANTFRLVETLSKFGHHTSKELDPELQQVSLHSVTLLEPFRTFMHVRG